MRYIATIGNNDYVLPADVRLSEFFETMAGMQKIEKSGYGDDKEYRLTKDVISVTIESVSDARVVEPVIAPDVPTLGHIVVAKEYPEGDIHETEGEI